jgi:hypothetical protein
LPRSAPACDLGAFESQGFTLAILRGDGQNASPGQPFATPLEVTVAALNTDEPVDGGQIAFVAPDEGPGAALAGSPATVVGGKAAASATANGIGGAYDVFAAARGAAPLAFHLANRLSPAPYYYLHLPLLLCPK